MPGVEGTYVRFQEAGDMFVGRTVSGLSSESANFSILPPLFVGEADLVERTINSVFSGMPVNLKYVAHFCLASLVHHSDFITRNVGEGHRIFSSSLFTDAAKLNDLKKIVRCGFEDDVSTNIKATGIPPHVSVLGKFKALEKNQRILFEEYQKTAKGIVRDVVKEIEKRALSNDPITYSGLDSTI